MVGSEVALFRRYPSLAERVPHCPFVRTPTPVTRLPLEGLGASELHVKWDDASCPIYGGNKPRKLEFLIGDALARGSRRIVTSGALGTHHGLATTVLGAAVGLYTSVALVDQPPSAAVRESLELAAAWGAELLYGRTVPGAVALSGWALARGFARGERPYLVWTGGSSARGNLGFVSAAFELARQIERGEAPLPREIWLAVGSGGTAAGLVLGLKLAGLAVPLRPVLVSDILPPSPRSLARSARATLRLLRRFAPEVPSVEVSPRDFPLDRSVLGRGYGAPTEASEEARAIAADAGMCLDATYTAKCFAALRDRARRGALPAGPVLFWNTFNSVDVAARAPRPPGPELLPGALRRRLG